MNAPAVAVPPDQVAQLAKLDTARANLDARRRAAWEALNELQRTLICHSAQLSPAFASVLWDDLPALARMRAWAAVLAWVDVLDAMRKRWAL